jgi:carboxyl-terminal processing protease
MRRTLLIALLMLTPAAARAGDDDEMKRVKEELKRANEEVKRAAEEAKRSYAEAMKSSEEARRHAAEAVAMARKSHEKFVNAKQVFDEVKQTLLNEYVDTLTEDELYQGAVAGMLATAANRKWDTLLSPTETHTMSGELAGQITGIGVELDIDTERNTVTILGTFPGSPAEKAGLKAGDRIIKVGDKLTRDGAEVAMRAIPGKAGSTVQLTVLREDQVLQKSITRAPITVSMVSDMMLPGNVGLVWVRTFNEKTPELLRQSLQRLAAARPRGLVIDLRHNMGGLLDKMVDSAGQLLPKGTLVATVIKRGNKEEPIRTAADPVLHGVPLTVLVDGGTASGAEVFAAALRDTVGAKLVGSRTTGKFNVQKVMDLGNGFSAKYTIGIFRTPSGAAPDGKGLEPDMPVDLDAKVVERVQRIREATVRLSGDAQLRAAVALIK